MTAVLEVVGLLVLGAGLPLVFLASTGEERHCGEPEVVETIEALEAMDRLDGLTLKARQQMWHAAQQSLAIRR